MPPSLSEPAQRLADYMGEISEKAFCASWISDHEFQLWRFLITGPGRYGSMELTQFTLDRLKSLMEDAGGWIVWGPDGREFVDIVDWIDLFGENLDRLRST